MSWSPLASSTLIASCSAGAWPLLACMAPGTTAPAEQCSYGIEESLVQDRPGYCLVWDTVAWVLCFSWLGHGGPALSWKQSKSDMLLLTSASGQGRRGVLAAIVPCSSGPKRQVRLWLYSRLDRALPDRVADTWAHVSVLCRAGLLGPGGLVPRHSRCCRCAGKCVTPSGAAPTR